MVGSDFIDWVYENISDLSYATKQQLGIIEIPLLPQNSHTILII